MILFANLVWASGMDIPMDIGKILSAKTISPEHGLLKERLKDLDEQERIEAVQQYVSDMEQAERDYEERRAACRTQRSSHWLLRLLLLFSRR